MEQLDKFLKTDEQIKQSDFSPKFICLVKSGSRTFKIKAISPDKINHTKKKRKVTAAFFTTHSKLLETWAKDYLKKTNADMEYHFGKFFRKMKKKYNGVVSEIIKPDNWRV
jgi:3'-phosphoadenosine 5'-phosphosulfate sulfotransferase